MTTTEKLSTERLAEAGEQKWAQNLAARISVDVCEIERDSPEDDPAACIVCAPEINEIVERRVIEALPDLQSLRAAVVVDAAVERFLLHYLGKARLEVSEFQGFDEAGPAKAALIAAFAPLVSQEPPSGEKQPSLSSADETQAALVPGHVAEAGKVEADEEPRLPTLKEAAQAASILLRCNGFDLDTWGAADLMDDAPSDALKALYALVHS